jgi:hypothetical protein
LRRCPPWPRSVGRIAHTRRRPRAPEDPEALPAAVGKQTFEDPSGPPRRQPPVPSQLLVTLCAPDRYTVNPTCGGFVAKPADHLPGPCRRSLAGWLGRTASRNFVTRSTRLPDIRDGRSTPHWTVCRQCCGRWRGIMLGDHGRVPLRGEFYDRSCQRILPIATKPAYALSKNQYRDCHIRQRSERRTRHRMARDAPLARSAAAAPARSARLMRVSASFAHVQDMYSPPVQRGMTRVE